MLRLELQLIEEGDAFKNLSLQKCLQQAMAELSHTRILSCQLGQCSIQGYRICRPFWLFKGPEIEPFWQFKAPEK